MNLAVRADQPLRTEQGNSVVVDIGLRVHLGEGDGDIAVVARRQFKEAVRRGTGDRLDEGRDLRAVLPAVAGGCHLWHHNEPGLLARGLLDQAEKIEHILLLLAERRVVLNGGGGI